VEVDPLDRVVGLGDAVVAVAKTGFWPVSLLLDGEWTRLLGFPAGLDVSSQVGVAVADGFVIGGVDDDRTVLFRFTSEGRFQGARTVFGIRAAAITAVGDTVVVFDVDRPLAAAVGPDLVPITTPGVVLDAAYDAGALVVLDREGAVHSSVDGGGAWQLLGSGYRAVMTTDGVHAVGESASVGINRYADGTLVRLEHAPWGPIAAWGDRLAVYDWSTESVWASTEEGWERLPLWASVGLDGAPAELVDGVANPTVVGVDVDGRTVLWRASARDVVP
jgi:hypothetical protein